MTFKLYTANGRRILTQEFGDNAFPDFFSVDGTKIIFAIDTVIEIAEYDSKDRAYEVYDAIINSYRAKKSFTLPPN